MTRRLSLHFYQSAACCTLFFLNGLTAWSQTAPVLPSKTPPPTETVYHLFFTHLNFLVGKANEVKASEPLRTYYQQKIGLTLSEHNALLRNAANCQDQVAKKDVLAMARVRELQRKYPPASGSGPPELFAELNRLEFERIALIQGHVTNLKTEMGAAGFQKVDKFIKGDFVQSASVKSLPNHPTNALSVPWMKLAG